MKQVKAFSTAKYNFLKKHSSCILEMISLKKGEKVENNIKQEVSLALLDYLTISKYNTVLGECYIDIEKEQKKFEQMIESLEQNLIFEEKRNAYLEIDKILDILKLSIVDIDCEERIDIPLKVIAMYQEFNEMKKKQSKEVTYGKHYK